jgi:alpha-galactosidase
MRSRWAAAVAAASLIAGTGVVTAGASMASPPAPATAQAAVAAVDGGGLAPRPPMGWNSWNKFGCDIDEELIRETADALISSGMKEAGYEYVNIDDCWMAPQRDAQGRLQPDPERFPHGIAALADYVHERGLKLGIYSSAGTKTCQGLPASLGHEKEDAQSFADWGVDYLKYDNCNNQGVPAVERYKAMGDALAATGRPIVYSICEWGSNQPWLWADGVNGDLWRTTGDISDRWSSFTSLLDQQVGLEKYSGPSAWNDPDMLEVGNGGMTTREYQAHMSLWSLLNAPLIAGNDLRSMDETTRQMLTDPEVLEVNQDWGGEQGSKRRDDGDTEVWAKPMSDGGAAVVLFNRGDTTRTITASPSELGLPSAKGYAVTDVWTDTTRSTSGPVRGSVPSHGAAMYVVRPTSQPTALPPAVTVSVETPAYVKPGDSATVKTTVYNDGLTAIEDTGVRVSAPEGWSVRGSGEIGDLPPRQSRTTTWAVAPSGSTEPGTVGLAVHGAWTWRETHHYASDTSAALALVEPVPAGNHYLSDVSWVGADNAWGPVERDTSNGESRAGDGKPITIGGTSYAKGLGAHATSEITYFTDRGCTTVTADVGIDDEVGDRGSVTFEVWADGERVAASDVVRGADAARPLTADVSGAEVVELRLTEAGDGNTYDHADWADATIVCS